MSTRRAGAAVSVALLVACGPSKEEVDKAERLLAAQAITEAWARSSHALFRARGDAYESRCGPGARRAPLPPAALKWCVDNSREEMVDKPIRALAEQNDAVKRWCAAHPDACELARRRRAEGR